MYVYEKESFICTIFICIFSVEDGTSIDIPSIENDDEFWQIIHRFEDGILAGIDLFISTPPSPRSIMDMKEHSLLFEQAIKRKTIESHSSRDLGKKKFRTNGNATRSTSDEQSTHDSRKYHR